jgi:hypothetical protein
VQLDVVCGGGCLIFPKSLNRAQCEALRAHTADLPNAQAQQVIDELAGRMDVAAVKDPIRYCATLIERVRRGEFVPSLALKIGERRRLENARAQTRAQTDSAVFAALRNAATRLPATWAASLKRIRLQPNVAAGETDGDLEGSS